MAARFLALRSLIATIILSAALCSTSQAQTWISISTDVSGDEQAGTPDGKELFYAYDPVSDTLSFKIEVFNISTFTPDFGVNLQVNIPGVTPTESWGNWGAVQNTTFDYNRLVTVWVTGAPPSTYAGTIGIADVPGVLGANFTNVAANNIDIEVDAVTNEIILRMPRQDLIPNSTFTGSTVTINVAASVGLSTAWGDDVFGAPGTATINTTIPLVPPTLSVPVLAATGVSVNPVLQWGPVIGATSYTYRYSKDINMVLDVQTGTTTLTNAPIGQLDGFTLYYWQVNCTDGTQTTNWSQKWLFTTGEAPLVFTGPTLWLPPDNSFDQEVPQVTLNWDDVFGANIYDLEYSTAPNMASPTDHQAIQSIYTISGLDFLTTYYWRVRARNDTLTGPWSDIWNFSTRAQDLADGIEELGANSPFAVYPNPAINEVFVEQRGPVTNEFQVMLVDPIGRVISQHTSRQGRITLDLTQQERGFYSVIITDGENSYVKRVIHL